MVECQCRDVELGLPLRGDRDGMRLAIYISHAISLAIGLTSQGQKANGDGHKKSRPGKGREGCITKGQLSLSRGVR